MSWSTILNKRDGYRQNFAAFDPEKVARFTQKRIEKILLDPGIVRNRLKVQAAVNNAKQFLKIQKEFGSFDRYIWNFVNGIPIVNKRKSLTNIPPTTKESDALSKDLIKRGFKFVGSTVIYAHMQACGLVNDHLMECWRYKETLILGKIIKKIHHFFSGPWARETWCLNHVFAQSHALTGRNNRDGFFSLFFPNFEYFIDARLIFS